MTTFNRKCNYNNETKNQLWMSVIGDMHDSICGCDQPFAHLLDNIFPEGHRDRDKPISYIINRDYLQCHSGGPEEEDGGMAPGTSAATLKQEEEKEGDDFPEENNVEELLAAVTDAEKR